MRWSVFEEEGCKWMSHKPLLSRLLVTGMPIFYHVLILKSKKISYDQELRTNSLTQKPRAMFRIR